MLLAHSLDVYRKQSLEKLEKILFLLSLLDGHKWRGINWLFLIFLIMLWCGVCLGGGVEWKLGNKDF
jgi:hypothetical protein